MHTTDTNEIPSFNGKKPKITYETVWRECEKHDFEVEITYVDGKAVNESTTGNTRVHNPNRSLEDY